MKKYFFGILAVAGVITLVPVGAVAQKSEKTKKSLKALKQEYVDICDEYVCTAVEEIARLAEQQKRLLALENEVEKSKMFPFAPAVFEDVYKRLERIGCALDTTKKHTSWPAVHEAVRDILEKKAHRLAEVTAEYRRVFKELRAFLDDQGVARTDLETRIRHIEKLLAELCASEKKM